MSIIALKKNIINSVWIIFSNGFATLVQWLLVSVMTKMFTLENVGIYSSANALIIPFITLFGLNIRAIQLTDVDDRFKIEDFFFVRFIGAILTIIVVIAITLIKNPNIYIFIFTIIVLVQRIAENFSDIIYNALIRRQNYYEYGLSMIIKSLISFGVFILIAYFSNNIIISLLSYSIIWVLMFLFYDARQIQITPLFLNKYKIDKVKITFLVRLCIPLAIVAFVNTLYDSVPKFFIEKYFGLKLLGIFSATSYISLIGGLFVTGITLIFSTKLAEMYKQNKDKIIIKIIVVQEILIITCCLAIFLAFYLFDYILIPALYTSEFLAYMDIVLMLIIALSFNFTARVLGTACTSMQKNHEQLITALFCISILVILCFVFVPKLGLMGAALSLLITYIMKNILLILVISITFRKRRKEVL